MFTKVIIFFVLSVFMVHELSFSVLFDSVNVHFMELFTVLKKVVVYSIFVSVFPAKKTNIRTIEDISM